MTLYNNQDTRRLEKSPLSLGIDIGSTTAKLIITRDGNVIYEKYERHFSKVRQKLLEMLKEVSDILDGEQFTAAISGSAGFGLAQSIGLAFVQEVFVVGKVISTLEPDTKAVIELGGEDAKIIFFDGGTDERMNGSCAGGTGAFIDQMASLLNITVDEMDALALKHKKIYPIASRCGVFAKTDIQPLLNQGAAKAGYCRLNFSGGSKSDYRRTCAGQKNQRQGFVFGRAAVLLQGVCSSVLKKRWGCRTTKRFSRIMRGTPWHWELPYMPPSAQIS